MYCRHAWNVFDIVVHEKQLLLLFDVYPWQMEETKIERLICIKCRKEKLSKKKIKRPLNAEERQKYKYWLNAGE